MSDPRIPLSEQREAVEHVLAMSRRLDPGIEAAARQAALTLAWLERRAELVREVDRLDRAEPALLATLKAFPDCKIVGVR